MATDREVMQQALEALETVLPQNMDPLIHPAKEALRARLAEPEPEPVAWMVYTQDGQSAYVTDNPEVKKHWRALPLYTTPPTRRPLTEEEIDTLWRKHASEEGFTTAQFVRAFARAAIAKAGGNDE